MRQVIKKRFTCDASPSGHGGAEERVEPALDQGASNTHSKSPGVRLVHVDGRVQALEVTCRCGDVSVLEIDYEQ